MCFSEKGTKMKIIDSTIIHNQCHDCMSGDQWYLSKTCWMHVFRKTEILRVPAVFGASYCTTSWWCPPRLAVYRSVQRHGGAPAIIGTPFHRKEPYGFLLTGPSLETGPQTLLYLSGIPHRATVSRRWTNHVAWEFKSHAMYSLFLCS